MTPGFLTCNTGRRPHHCHSVTQGTLGEKRLLEDSRFGLGHGEMPRGQLLTGAQEEMGLKRSVWTSLWLE